VLSCGVGEAAVWRDQADVIHNQQADDRGDRKLGHHVDFRCGRYSEVTLEAKATLDKS
jgi:ribosomal protein L32